VPDRAIPVYLERGQKRTFAGAIEWPGWCRSGRDEASAREALVAYALRYARVVSSSRLGFRAPKDLSDLDVLETLRGNATTDFGVPGGVPKADARPMTATDLARLRRILESCWRAFDAAQETARGKTLRKGPRGGGRPLLAIIRHVLEADAGYLGALGWRYRLVSPSPHGIEPTRQAIIEGLAASARGEIAAAGPRGGKRWKPRYFVRRSAWHVLDHAWEIEDRIT
jgi:hypothetical protein